MDGTGLFERSPTKDYGEEIGSERDAIKRQIYQCCQDELAGCAQLKYLASNLSLWQTAAVRSIRSVIQSLIPMSRILVAEHAVDIDSFRGSGRGPSGMDLQFKSTSNGFLLATNYRGLVHQSISYLWTLMRKQTKQVGSMYTQSDSCTAIICTKRRSSLRCLSLFREPTSLLVYRIISVRCPRTLKSLRQHSPWPSDSARPYIE